jgi:hypothetical protein
VWLHSVGVEAHEHVQVVIYDGKAADGDCEGIRKVLKSEFDPLSATEWTFADQECSAGAAGDAVAPALDGHVDELRAGYVGEWISCDVPRKLPESRACVKIATRALALSLHPLRVPPDQVFTRVEFEACLDRGPVTSIRIPFVSEFKVIGAKRRSCGNG